MSRSTISLRKIPSAAPRKKRITIVNCHRSCEGDGDVVGVVTHLVRGGAQVLHGDQVVELSVQLDVQERKEKGEDGEGEIEVEEERGELKERRTWVTMRMIVMRLRLEPRGACDTTSKSVTRCALAFMLR